MSKEAWRAFLRWLDQASDEELARKAIECLALQQQLTDPDLVREMPRVIRMIEEEQVARLGILGRQRQPRP
jgi:hypothetical protein